MDNSHLAKMIFYSQLQQGQHSQGGQCKRYKDALKANLAMLDTVWQQTGCPGTCYVANRYSFKNYVCLIENRQ